MNNIMVSLKRFLKNKNTVTIIGILLVLGILYYTYNSQINKAVTPVSVPVAATDIQPRTLITEDMVTTMNVPAVSLKNNVIRSKSLIVGKYSNYNTLIPEGSMFFTSTVINKEDLPNYAVINVADGEVPYYFAVNMATTYGNSIMPNSYIDIYMKAENENGVVMVGKLIENIKVLAVKDSSGKNVFENTSESRTPASLIFGVEPKINILLKKAEYIDQYSVELFPVPHGGTIEKQEGEVSVTSATLKAFIEAHTVPNDDIKEAEKEAEEAEKKNNTTTNNNTTNNNTTNNNTTNNNQ